MKRIVGSLYVVSILLHAGAVKADEKETNLYLRGGSSALGIVAANGALTNLDNADGYSKKVRVWEEKDKELWNAMERRNQLRNEVDAYRRLLPQKGYRRHLMKGLKDLEKKLADANFKFYQLVDESSRTRVIDFALGEFKGERRRLTNRMLLLQGVRWISLLSGLTAVYEGTSVLVDRDYSSKDVPNVRRPSSPSTARGIDVE